MILEIKKNEITEKQKRIKISSLNKTNLKSLLSIDLRMPSAYEIYKKGKEKIIWIQRDTDKGTVNVLAYELKKRDFSGNEHKQKIIKIRDSVGKLFLPGRNKDSHMITEEAYEPYVKKVKVKGFQAIETRGTWEVKNDFMAGPFINLQASLHGRVSSDITIYRLHQWHHIQHKVRSLFDISFD